MIELGKKAEIFGAELLEPLTLPWDGKDSEGCPIKMPSLPKGHSVIAGYDQGLGERMIVCESLEDMRTLFTAYGQGYALRLNWYSGEDPGWYSGEDTGLVIAINPGGTDNK